jgi:hypothetical protein
MDLTGFKALDELQAEQRSDAGTFNAVLSRLAQRRVARIAVEGPFHESKLAWKVATYLQPVLYRLVTLADGVAVNWNGNNILCCFLSARAVVETVTVLLHFEEQLNRAMEGMDFAAIDSLVMRTMFATRDEEMLRHNPDNKAVNILTLVEKLDKRLLPGLLDHYGTLSERCHPNSFGQHGIFGVLNHDDGTTEYADPERRPSFFEVFICTLPLLELAESAFHRLDVAVPKLAEAHARAKLSR